MKTKPQIAMDDIPFRAIAFRYGPACDAPAGSLASEAAAVLPGRGVAP